MCKQSSGFLYLKEKFPAISDAKIKEGIFVGPQVRQLIENNVFEQKLNATEKAAWVAFKVVCTNFLGKTHSQNYKQLVSKMLKAYQKMVATCL